MEQQRPKIIYYLLFSLGMILVGSSVVIGKELTMQLPVFFTVEVRLLISAIIFYGIVRAKKEHFPAMDRKDYLFLFIQSATGIVLYNVLLFYGLRYTSGVEAGIILSLSPIFAAIAAFLLLQERLKYQRWIGVVLAVTGVILVNVTAFGKSGASSYHLSKILGNIMIVGVALSEAIFAVTGKYNRNKLSAYQVCLVITSLAFILFLPFAIYQLRQVNYTALVQTKLLLQLAYFTVFVGIIPYILTFTAVKYISATTAGVLTVLIPISSILLSVIFLGEKMQITMIAGSLVALSGVYIVTKFE